MPKTRLFPVGVQEVHSGNGRNSKPTSEEFAAHDEVETSPGFSDVYWELFLFATNEFEEQR